MGLSKTEINLRRLLASAPRQQNQAKLIHYVATLRELLEQLTKETTPDGLPRGMLLWLSGAAAICPCVAICFPLFLHDYPMYKVLVESRRFNLSRDVVFLVFGEHECWVSKAKLNDYSEKIESIASQLASPVEIFVETATEEIPTHIEEEKVVSPPGLRKRPVPSSFLEDKSHDNNIGDHSSKQVKLDAAAHSHIDKHSNVLCHETSPHFFYRKLQEDLTDEMVQMAWQLKENSLMMNRSVKNAEKILDSTEQAIEHSLASTSHVNVRATNVFSQSSKTSCFTWLAMLAMVMVFMMVVLLIRIT
ncbi:hypothetical protein KSS87_022098 [Heliosperma pusillum]|nr:hypothetical protein KSS87_022098 [Heliosperma pusillum]